VLYFFQLENNVLVIVNCGNSKTEYALNRMASFRRRGMGWYPPCYVNRHYLELTTDSFVTQTMGKLLRLRAHLASYPTSILKLTTHLVLKSRVLQPKSLRSSCILMTSCTETVASVVPTFRLRQHQKVLHVPLSFHTAF
jgi:hypothetical protein